MKVLVVYESMFGNTHRIAEAVGTALASSGAEVEVMSVDDADPKHLESVDLLIAGAPTHVRTMSTAPTRALARHVAKKDGVTADTDSGIRAWLHRSQTGARRSAAAFDTHLGVPRTGAASRRIAELLHSSDWNIIVPPASFLVTDVDGPLVDGELERAATWALGVLEAMPAGDASAHP